MGSHYSQIVKNKKKQSEKQAKPRCIAELDETDFYFFTVKEGARALAQGGLTAIKYQLPADYLHKPFKNVTRNDQRLTAVITF